MLEVPVRYEPVPGTRWQSRMGRHADDVVEVTRANANSVFFKYVLALSRSMSRNARHKSGQMTLRRETWNAQYIPYTERDRRACLVEPEATVNLLPDDAEHKRHTVFDTNTAGDYTQVALAKRQCTSCGEHKLLGLFSRSTTVCDACRDNVALTHRPIERKEPTPPMPTSPVATLEPAILDPSVPTPALAGKRWVVRAYVMEEREFVVEAASWREAGEQAEHLPGLQLEIISINPAA